MPAPKLQEVMEALHCLTSVRALLTSQLASGMRNDAPDESIAMRQTWRLAEIKTEVRDQERRKGWKAEVEAPGLRKAVRIFSSQWMTMAPNAVLTGLRICFAERDRELPGEFRRVFGSVKQPGSRLGPSDWSHSPRAPSHGPFWMEACRMYCYRDGAGGVAAPGPPPPLPILSHQTCPAPCGVR